MLSEEAVMNLWLRANHLDGDVKRLVRFANLVAEAAVKAEREACAKLCDESVSSIWDYHTESHKEFGKNTCENLARRIRARGESC